MCACVRICARVGSGCWLASADRSRGRVHDKGTIGVLSRDTVVKITNLSNEALNGCVGVIEGFDVHSYR